MNNAKMKVLFVCTNNSARSQMAEALLRYIYGDWFEAFSAGSKPTEINKYAVSAMKELNIDISKYKSKSIDKFMNKDMEYAVTMCDDARKSCTFLPNAKQHVHKSFNDPAKHRTDEVDARMAFRKVRDEIKDWIIEYFGPIAKKLNDK